MTEFSRPGAARIFVDVSETLGLDVRTGIQRVVREITRKNETADGAFVIAPVLAIDGEFRRLSDHGEKQLRSPNPVAYAPAAPYRTPLPIRLARALLSPFPELTRKARRRRAGNLFDKRLAVFAQGEPLVPGPGDRVVLADTYGHSTVMSAAGRARDRGAALIALTYDLFPLTHSYLMDAESVAHFANTVPAGMAASDATLTISDWCIDELRRFGVTGPIGRFYLGYDIPKHDGLKHDGPKLEEPSEMTDAAWPAGLWEGDAPVFLMVGTIATSKGHPVALAAFERLWARGVECRLLMVGRPGWEVDTLIRRLNEHPELGRRLFLVHGASDGMVNEAFGRAFAAIIGSVVEGFGLPLVEALARALPVIASDIAIFREIAGDTALRYEQSNPDALADAVTTMIEHRDLYAGKAEAFTWLDWDGARAAFAAEVDRLAKQAGK